MMMNTMKTKHKTGGMLPWLSATAAWLAAPLAVLLAAGCSANEPEAGTEVAGIPVSVGVHVSATAGQTVVTRAAEGMNSPTTRATASVNSRTTRAGADVNSETTGLAAGDQFYALLTGTTVDATTFTTADGGAATPGVQPYLKQNAGSTGATITAYYPWRIGGTDGAPNASPSLATFTVSQDQSSDAGYRQSDLMYASTTAINTTTGQATLTFHHRMAKVVVAVDNRISATVTAVNLVQGYRTVNLKTPAELVPYAAGETGAALSDPMGQSEPLRVMAGGTSAAATVSAAALLPPQTIRKDRRFIEVQTDKGTAYFALTADQTLASNTQYTATCELNRATLGATTTVSGWTVGTMEDNDAVQGNMVFRVGTAVFQMNFVKGGTYTNKTGTNYVYSPGDMSDYYMGQTEVTQGLWKAVMGSLTTGSSYTSDADGATYGDNYPMVNTTYAQFQTFVARLNDATADQRPTGWSFAIPSADKWEYAAHEGTLQTTYDFSGSATATDVAWFNGEASNTNQAVGLKLPNALGLYDMSGNVWEFTTEKNSSGNYIPRGGSVYFASTHAEVPVSAKTHTCAATGVTTHQGLRLVLVQSRTTAMWSFDYTGSVQTLALTAGTYSLEAWGAQGGDSYGRNDVTSLGGKGGYARIQLLVPSSQTLYIYVGGKGPNGITTGATTPGPAGGWNGGGNGGIGKTNFEGGGAGGGATHIATSDIGPITTTHSIYNGGSGETGLLLVAGGAGGGSWKDNPSNGGDGGGTSCIRSVSTGAAVVYSNGNTDNNGTNSCGANGATDTQTGIGGSQVGAGGGGGGFLGGNTRTSIGANTNGSVGGAGGSSWGANGTVGGCTASDFHTESGLRIGAGRVVITRLDD